MKRILFTFSILLCVSSLCAQQDFPYYTGAVVTEVKVTGKNVTILTNVPAERIIDGKNYGVAERATYVLKFQDHTLTLKADGYYPQTQSIRITTGGPDTYSFELQPLPAAIEKDVVISTNVPATRILDKKNVGVAQTASYHLLEGNHYVTAKADGYVSASKSIKVSANSKDSYMINLIKKPTQWEQFIMFNYAGSAAPQHSFGVTYGQVKRWGWYVNMMLGTGMHYKADYDGSYYYPLLTGKTSQNRLSFTGGGIFRFIPYLGVYAGLGYGYRSLTAEMPSGKWALIRSSASPLHGAHLETGLMGGYKGITLSVGFSSIVSVNGGLVEGKVGIGYMFNR